MYWPKKGKKNYIKKRQFVNIKCNEGRLVRVFQFKHRKRVVFLLLSQFWRVRKFLIFLSVRPDRPRSGDRWLLHFLIKVEGRGGEGGRGLVTN